MIFIVYTIKKNNLKAEHVWLIFSITPSVFLYFWTSKLWAEIFIKHHVLPEPQEDHHSLCTVSLSTLRLRSKIEINCYDWSSRELPCDPPAALHNRPAPSEPQTHISQHRTGVQQACRQPFIQTTGKTSYAAPVFASKTCQIHSDDEPRLRSRLPQLDSVRYVFCFFRISVYWESVKKHAVCNNRPSGV